GGTEGAHARRAVDVHALGEGEEDLLVPHGRHPLEHAVDEADGPRPAERRPEDVTVSGGWAVLGVEHVSRLVVRQRRPEKDDDRRSHVPRSARRRGPATAGATLSVQPSSPGTTIRTTGTARSGRVRSTRIACSTPAPRNRSSSCATSSSIVSPGTCATSSNARRASAASALVCDAIAPGSFTRR